MNRPPTFLSTPRYIPVLGLAINPTGILMDFVNAAIKGAGMALGVLGVLAVLGVPS